MDPDQVQGGVTRDQLPKGSRPSAVFTVIGGEHQGERFEIRDPVVLGRECALSPCFGASGVSRFHARIWCSAQGAFHIEDLGSSNGTFVNERRIGRRTLVVGDKIRLGPNLTLEFALGYDPQSSSDEGT
jgi:pSer/pThr/pTyr-binding forkhead associated (FHA) protein